MCNKVQKAQELDMHKNNLTSADSIQVCFQNAWHKMLLNVYEIKLR